MLYLLVSTGLVMGVIGYICQRFTEYICYQDHLQQATQNSSFSDELPSMVAQAWYYQACSLGRSQPKLPKSESENLTGYCRAANQGHMCTLRFLTL